MNSIEFLKENRNYWTFGGLGRFILTKGAIVAKEPERFEIEDVRPYEGEDIAWRLYYKQKNETNTSGSNEANQKIKEAQSPLSGNHFDRPWVGGIDTPHTMFYHERFGSKVNQIIKKALDTEVEHSTVLYLNGIIIRNINSYPISRLISDKDIAAAHAGCEIEGKSLNSQSIYQVLYEIMKSKNTALNEATNIYFVRQDGILFPFPMPMIEFLQKFEKGCSLQQLLQNSAKKELYIRLWQHSLSHRFLRIHSLPRKHKEVVSLH